jgi:hypothetical protein
MIVDLESFMIDGARMTQQSEFGVLVEGATVEFDDAAVAKILEAVRDKLRDREDFRRHMLTARRGAEPTEDEITLLILHWRGEP